MIPHPRRESPLRPRLPALGILLALGLQATALAAPMAIDRIENEIVLHGRRNNQAWFEPAIGMIPGEAGQPPQVFIRATYLTGNDVGPQFYLKTDNLGKTWTNPILCQNWRKEPQEENVFEEPWFGFLYHRKTGTFLALGNTHFVRDGGGNHFASDHQPIDPNNKNEGHYRSAKLRGRIVLSRWNPAKNDFDPWEAVNLPPEPELGIYYNAQFHEQPDGTILLPGYYRGALKPGEDPKHIRVTVLRFSFDGKKLTLLEHGNILAVDTNRGLAEPSLIAFGGKFFLTIRHDLRGYVARSDDGLQFSEPTPWRFDDGEDLGNYNTQQKWLKHRDTLYLVYNRKSELNDGVFRSRAPLFMAEVDPATLRVIRQTERIVFPQNGARMGNFNLVNVSDDEVWITSGEWLQGKFAHSQKGDLFWVDRQDFNYIRYIGDLLLARVYWK